MENLTQRSLVVAAPDRDRALERGTKDLAEAFLGLVLVDIAEVHPFESASGGSKWLVTGNFRDRQLEDDPADADEPVRAPTPAQLKRIRVLSGEVLSSPEALFGLTGYPATHAEAQLMLAALGRIRLEEEPAPGPETQLVYRIRHMSNLPTATPKPEPVEEATDAPGEAPTQVKTCSHCRETKPTTEFGPARTKDGLDYRCLTCAAEKPSRRRTTIRRDPTSSRNAGKVAASVAKPGGPMKQQVVVTRLADRHEGPERSFAESLEVIVEAGPLRSVLQQVAGVVSRLGVSRYTITIGEPYEAVGS